MHESECPPEARDPPVSSILARAFAPQVTFRPPQPFVAGVSLPAKSSTSLSLSGLITALATRSGPTAPSIPMVGSACCLQLEGGVHGVVVAGSTGEAATLTDAEYDQLLASAVERIGGRIRSWPAPACRAPPRPSNRPAVPRPWRQPRTGGHPPYVRPTQAGLIAHYRAVADQGGLPVVLYNVPGRTGCDMQPETVAELASHPNIVGIKEAVGDTGRVQALLALRSPAFAVLSGDDGTAARSIRAGIDGLISVGSNVLPGAYRRMCELAAARPRSHRVVGRAPASLP